jgi:hypothetical protein
MSPHDWKEALRAIVANDSHIGNTGDKLVEDLTGLIFSKIGVNDLLDI